MSLTCKHNDTTTTTTTTTTTNNNNNNNNEKKIIIINTLEMGVRQNLKLVNIASMVAKLGNMFRKRNVSGSKNFLT